MVAKVARAKLFLQHEAQTIAGVESVNFYKENFTNQGFTDKQLEKWEEVERRKPQSRWRGFQYGSNANNGTKKRKAGAATNYSPAAEKRPILTGPTQELMHSIRWEKTANGIRVYSDKVYAKLHNEGGPMKVFGRHSATMPKRQFIGPSKALNEKLKQLLLEQLKTILK